MKKDTDIKWIHPDCKRTKICQETEGFKGTEHEGVNVCEDGCVWANMKKKKASDDKKPN